MAEEKDTKKEKKEGEEAAEVKPKSKKKLIIIIAAVVLLAGGGAAAMLMGGAEPPKEGEEQATEEPIKHYLSFTMDPIIVNLSENASFLKIKLTIEYDPEIIAHASGEGEGHGGGGAGGEGEGAGGPPAIIAEKEAQVKDAIIRVLASKSPADVLTSDGKETLKEELIEAVNEAIGLEEGPVVNIYFHEFLVQ